MKMTVTPPVESWPGRNAEETHHSGGPVGLESLVLLQTWLSPSFPVGGFAYSHGLEQAVAEGLVRDEKTLKEWILSLCERGSLWNDAILLAEASRRVARSGDLVKLAALASALAGSASRLEEGVAQGRAFLGAAAPWGVPDDLNNQNEVMLPVAIGAMAGHHGIGASAAVAAYLNAFALNQCQIAIRLSIIGQNAAAALASQYGPVLATTASRAVGGGLAALGGITMLAEIEAMRHETAHARLFIT